MGRVTRRRKVIRESADSTRLYPLSEAIRALKACPQLRFGESVDVSVNLGVDPRKSDQIVRGSVVLPNGTGKKVRVAVFAQGDAAKSAEDAGADIVGYEDLADSMKAGEVDYDVVIASPDAMPVVGKLGQKLGPRGLMPNLKTGTVAADVATAVRNAKSGQVRYRVDRGGVVHASVGKLSFGEEMISENVCALLRALNKSRPSVAKGVYLKKVTLSSTMGPGLTVEHSSLKL